MQWTRMDEIQAAIERSAPMGLSEIVTEEVREFKRSPAYARMREAESYFLNRSDIQRKFNDIPSRSNVKMEHPVLRRLITQKVSYLLSKPFSVVTDNKAYGEALNRLFDRPFRRKLRGFVSDAIEYGIGFLQPYVDETGLAFMRLPAREVVPLWEDTEHERLQGIIRFYPQTVYQGHRKTEITHAELWMPDGVRYFVADGGPRGQLSFAPDPEYGEEPRPHFFWRGKGYNWETPVTWMKYNDDELPLCYFLREMIDEINWQNSVTADTLRDVAKFIFVLKNYGGADLAEFVADLKQSLAVKVDADGGVDKLSADLNIDAVMSFLDSTRRDLYDYAAAVDTKDPDLGNASGTAIQFRYMDLQTDCEALGEELQDAVQRLKPVLDSYLTASGEGDYSGADFSLLYNMDMPVNEADVINNARNSDGLISRRTILENHPWVTDVEEELERLEAEKQEALEEAETFGFGQPPESPDGVTDDEEP